ncbi:MAG: T9SS type A sorting domain-containing protein [Ignavibacteriales bacterium]|nr:T9SS type A sorting domain-containing protein [Ignavibacteriales bacterium]
MKHLIFSLMLIIATASFSFVQSQSWLWVNPYPTGNAITKVHFLNAKVGFVIGENGTLMVSSDSGKNWSQINVSEGYFYTDIFFLDSLTGWVLGNEYYGNAIVFKTTDGGLNWVSQSLTTSSYQMNDIYFYDGQKGWVVGENGAIFLTTNGGGIWQNKTLSAISNPSFYSVIFLSPTSGLVLGNSSFYDGYGFSTASTIDGGNSWSLKPSGLINMMSGADILMDSSIITIGENGLILKTTDRGLHWGFNASNGGQSDLTSVDFYNADSGIAVGVGGTIIKTTNGGNDWRTILSGFTCDFKSVQMLTENTVFAGGSRTDYYSTSGNYILKSTDRGETWENLARSFEMNFSVTGIWLVSPSTAWITGVDFNASYIYSTNDTGITWNLSYSSPSGISLNDIIFTDAQIGIAVGNSNYSQGYLLRTTNNGATWTSQSFSNVYNLYKLAFPSSDTGFVVGDGGKIYKTTNQGVSWTGLNSGRTSNFYDVTFANSQTGWIAGSGEVLKTTNGGQTWSGYSLPDQYYSVNAISFPTLNDGYAASNGLLYKTTNGGLTWTNISIPSYYGLSDIYFVDALKGFVMMSDGVYKTIDGGSSWQLDLTVSYVTVFSNNREGKLWVGGSYTRILRAAENITVSVFGNETTNYPTENTLSQNYPNPFNPSTNINFALPKREHVSLKIYNILGEEIITLYNTILEPGNYDIQWNGENTEHQRVATGIYFYRIEIGKYKEVKKMALIY